jgi:hypothetical protein
MPTIGRVNRTHIIEIKGKPYIQFYDENNRIMGRMAYKQPRSSIEKKITYITKNVVINRTYVRQSQRTKDYERKKLSQTYAQVRFLQNPNLYSIGGMIGGDVGLGFAIAHKSVQILKQGIDLGADIYSASTGETMRVSNFKNVLARISNPYQLVDDVIGATINSLKVRRENYSLNYNRELTGNVINYKSKGRY